MKSRQINLAPILQLVRNNCTNLLNSTESSESMFGTSRPRRISHRSPKHTWAPLHVFNTSPSACQLDMILDITDLQSDGLNMNSSQSCDSDRKWKHLCYSSLNGFTIQRESRADQDSVANQWQHGEAETHLTQRWELFNSKRKRREIIDIN